MRTIINNERAAETKSLRAGGTEGMSRNKERLQELASAEGISLMKCQCGSFQLVLGGASFHLSSKSMKSLCEVLLNGLQSAEGETTEYTVPVPGGHDAPSQSMH